MDKKIKIYCPECEKLGRKKRLIDVDQYAKGIIYPYCKQCKKEIKVSL